MTLEEQLKSEILNRYKSVRAFTTAIDVPYSTLDSVFKRGISNAGVSTMIKVFGALDLDIESISSGELYHRDRAQKTSPGTLEAAPGEDLGAASLRAALLRNFDQLNQDGRERLADYSDDLVASGKYIKTAPSIAIWQEPDTPPAAPELTPEEEADQFAAMTREQFLSEKLRESQAPSARESDAG